MNLLNRLNNRLKEEGCNKTFKYGATVCANAFTTFWRDTYLDLKYSGRVLHGNKTSTYKHLGAHDVYHTDYSVMPLVFSNICIKPDDILVDVGCGKGRVINYWLSQKLSNQIYGLEIDPSIAVNTSRQFANYPNVQIIQGDAIKNLPAGGTVFYFYNPFSTEKVVEFEQRLHAITGKNPVTVIYYNPISINVFENNKWDIRKIDFEKDFGLQRWGRLNKYHQLAILTKSN